ncbi:MAG: CoA transferase [Burkholderiales bacterium]|nr:CoA transferase [Burkholderiales bacterium]
MSSHEQMPATSALAGLRVLDFTSMIAGPYAGRLLADAGAEVVKIEPAEGEDMRSRAPSRDGHSLYFGQLNAGKKSIVLDLKNKAGVALAKRLVEKADVVLENFRPGVMARLGLDYPALAAINPRLVYCAISGYGQVGPNRDKPAYAPIVHAASGFDRALMRYAGDRTQPAASAIFVADLMGGIYAMSGIQTALLARAQTGRGQLVDVALMDCMQNLLVYEIAAAQLPPLPPRLTYGPIAAADGDVIVTPITQRNFHALADAIGRPELKTDERFARVATRSRHWRELMNEIEAWTRSRRVAECLGVLETAGVPCSHFGEPEDALTDAHVRARGLLKPVRDGAGEFLGVNPPYRLSATPAELRSPVPAVGEHSDALCADWLELDRVELARARAEGAFGN